MDNAEQNSPWSTRQNRLCKCSGGLPWEQCTHCPGLFKAPEQLLRLAALDPWLPQSCHPCKTSDSENYTTRIHEQPSLECLCLPQVSGSTAASVVGDRRRVRAGASLQPLPTRGFENLTNCPWASELGHLAQPAVNLRLFCFLCWQV